MDQSTTTPVAWQQDVAAVRAVWARANESVEWIAHATDTFVSGLLEILDIPAWIDLNRSPWPVDEDAQRQLILANPVVDEDDRPLAGGGYGLSLYGADLPSPKLRIDAGAITVGSQIPLQYAGLSFNPRFTQTPPREVVDDLVALAARAWQPLVVTYTTTAVNKEAARRGWQVPAGYRLWISSEVGRIADVVDGLTVRPMEGGTLLSAPDDWEASAVAQAMNATLEANGIDEMPH